MQNRNDEKFKVAAGALGVANLVAYFLFGKMATTALDLGILYYFHQKGEKNRKVANFKTSSKSFFASYLPEGFVRTDEVENAARNIACGFESFADELGSIAEKGYSYKPR